MKKTISFWLAAVLSVSLLFCSCGQQGQGNTAPAETTASAAETRPAETTAAAETRPAETTAAAAETKPSGTAAAETRPAGTAVGAETAGTETSSAEPEAPAKLIEAPKISAADFPVTDGSTATLPLAWMLYRLCTGEDQSAAERAMSFTKTNNAYIRLMDKEADLVIAYEPGPNAASDPRYKDLELKPIGLDALVFLCNTANPVQSLTTAQLKDIYTGKIRNWKELGGEDAEIIPFQREVNSGSQTLMEKLLMKGTPMMDAPEELRPGEMGELVDSVARYSNTRNALGYSVYYYARNMYQRPNLRFMAADDVGPSPESIRDGDYPYVNPFYAAVRKDEPKDTNARKLFDWFTGEDGQSLVDAMGYVSIEKADKKLPEDLDGRVSLETGRLEGNTRRLAVSGVSFDGDAGVVILDQNFQVADRIEGIAIRGDEDLARIRGSVFPAGLQLFTGTGGSKKDDVEDGIGLYDIDRKAWAMEPTANFCYTESTDGKHAVYYIGEWPEWYEQNGKELYRGTVNVYDDTGVLLRTETVSSFEEFENLLRNTSYRTTAESTWNEEEDTVIYDSGTGITVTMHYDDEPEKCTAVLKQNGTVVAESTDMTIRPYMVDESDEDFVPHGWWIVQMYNSRRDAEGYLDFDDAGFLIADREGRIVYREAEGSSYSLSMADENFCVLWDWNSGKYVIRDYNGRELFSWIMPEHNEYW